MPRFGLLLICFLFALVLSRDVLAAEVTELEKLRADRRLEVRGYIELGAEMVEVASEYGRTLKSIADKEWMLMKMMDQTDF